MNARENLATAVSIDFIQSALKSRAFKIFCVAGIVSSAYDSYVGMKNLQNDEYLDTASSAFHVAVEISATAGLIGLRRLASGVSVTIDDPNLFPDSLLPGKT